MSLLLFCLFLGLIYVAYVLLLSAPLNIPLMFVFRSINYDERDPFLCNACGFCKYAKFDYTLTARPCCAVDPIENEEDRKKVLIFVKTRSDSY